jgi:hypothetical protein
MLPSTEMHDSVLPAQQHSTEEFREQRRNPSDEQAKKSKTSMPTPGLRDPRPRLQGKVPTKNFFGPLRTSEMDVKHTLVEGTSDKPNSESQQGR